MKTIRLVTGNKGKLTEWQRLIPAEFKLESIDIDLEEIQSADPLEIAADKARKAYALVGQPVVVEDVSAGLVKLGGLPGPLIKIFEKVMGKDALHALAGDEETSAIVSCSIAFYDGKAIKTFQGVVHGLAVAPRGEGGFGFDKCFQPDGQSKTYGEMNPVEKDAISHRSKAVALFIEALEKINC